MQFCHVYVGLGNPVLIDSAGIIHSPSFSSESNSLYYSSRLHTIQQDGKNIGLLNNNRTCTTQINLLRKNKSYAIFIYTLF